MPLTKYYESAETNKATTTKNVLSRSMITSQGDASFTCFFFVRKYGKYELTIVVSVGLQRYVGGWNNNFCLFDCFVGCV